MTTRRGTLTVVVLNDVRSVLPRSDPSSLDVGPPLSGYLFRQVTSGVSLPSSVPLLMSQSETTDGGRL